ncbi:MAG: SEC-C metal-binding domain-containing protein, partial [Treponema sp.]|nr:SEC-C metal-binding domain-containing protein [Treponema sp.]
DCFKLNQVFYFDVLNEKKTGFLEDKYAAIYKKKLKPAIKGDEDGGGNEDDDDFSEMEDATPFVRESPKIGRNVPCPCGSGKKYKKCCGK